MKRIHLSFISLSFLLFFPFSSMFAQSNSDWNPIGLTVNGRNLQNGVEAFYQLNKCNNEDVIFIKFINHNTNEVAISWEDVVFTKDLKWVNNKKSKNNNKTLNIKANEEIHGDCLGTNKTELVIKVHDFIKNMNDFKLFKTTLFQVTNIEK